MSLIFMMSHLCDAGTLPAAVINHKHFLKVSVGQEMRVAVSHLIPWFEKLRSYVAPDMHNNCCYLIMK